MTRDQEAKSVRSIEFCRLHFRKLGTEAFAQRGAATTDIAIAAAYAAVDLAQHVTGDPASAIAYVRLALDVFEESAPATAETMQ